jgi:hypothetical protein
MDPFLLAAQRGNGAVANLFGMTERNLYRLTETLPGQPDAALPAEPFHE